MIGSAEKPAPTVRELASEILFKVDRNQAYADILLDQALRANRLDERDRALLTELVYGTLRWRGAIDARLGPHLRRPLPESDVWLRNLLRLTAYQLIYLDRVPDYAAVNDAVELAKRRGGRKVAGFVNGVLRNLLRKRDAVELNIADSPDASFCLKYSHPEWLARRWFAEFGREQAEALMRANNEPAPLVLRVNTSKCTREGLLARLLKAGFAATATTWSPQGISLHSAGPVEKILGFIEGWFAVQGEASQLVSFLLAPLPGERILDACAAPGGKSAHMAELMNDQGEIVAIDRSARGVEKINQNTSRLALRSIRARRADAGADLVESAGGVFDRVLLDAPCSGLGTLRAHPEIKWQRGEKDIRRLSSLQAKLLDNVAVSLRPGGILVYSTCTLTSDENERNLENFLAHHTEFELQDAARYLPEQAKALVRGAYFTALPQRHGTDGFFAARMRKVS